MLKRLIPASALAIAVVTALPAAAEASASKIRIVSPTPGGESEIVSFGDLDVNSRSGARALLSRLDRAAGKMCGYSLLSDLRKEAHTKCVHETVDRAVAAIDSPVLTALNDSDRASSS